MRMRYRLIYFQKIFFQKALHMVIITGDDNWWFLIQYLDYIVWTVAESLNRESSADAQEVAATYD